MLKENGMVMMSEVELEEIINKANNEKTNELETRNKMLRIAIMDLMKNNNETNKDIRVSKLDFLEMYDDALDEMFENPEMEDGDNDIYRHDITVHWHGIYCSCGDGATAYNHIIPAIQSVYEEDNEEY